MPNYNRVTLVGHLTRDPEVRHTKNGTAVCEFGLAVNRRYGEGKEEVCFVDVTAWSKQGETIAEYFEKGSAILVEGRLCFDSWETSEGRRSKLYVTAERFEFMGGESSADRSPVRDDEVPGGTEDDEDEPFEDVPEDEIPF